MTSGLNCMHHPFAGRRRVPAAPRHSSHSYADYISELQHTGAANGNRLALHAGRQTHVRLALLSLIVHLYMSMHC